MKKNLKKLIEKPFVRNILIVVTGAAAAQGISMVLAPIITRLYGPEAYGLMGIFMAIILVVGPVSALTYPIAIVLPKDDRDAKGLIRLSLYLSTGIAVLSGIILLLSHDWIVEVFRMEKIAPFLYLIPFVILFSGMIQVSEQWLIRTKQFKATAKVTMMQSIIIQGGKAGAGFVFPAAAVLIFLSALGEGVKALMLILSSRKSAYAKSIDPQTKPLTLKQLAKTYHDFPVYRAPQLFIDSVTQSLPILLLSVFFGAASVGFYTICRTVLKLPTTLIGKSVGDVFYPRIAEAEKNGEDITGLLRKATLGLSAAGAIPFGLVVLFGPSLFGFAFGADWGQAGEYARWIALWSFSSLALQPSLKALAVLSAQSLHLKFTVASLFIRLGALAVGHYLFASDLVAVALFGLSSGLLNVLLILATLQLSRNRVRELLPLQQANVSDL